MELATAACLAIMCLASCAVGGYNPLPESGIWASQRSFEDVVRVLFLTGFIAPIFWITSVAIFHPFNAGLGAGERQGRTLQIGVVTAGIALTLAGTVRAGYLTIFPPQSATSLAYVVAYCTIIAGAIVWIAGLAVLLNTARKEAASVLWTGLPPKPKK